MILFFARHAAVTALLAATAWAAGRLVLRRWAGPAPAALAVAVGLAVLAQVLHLLGLLGWLQAGPILALAAAVHLLAIPDWRRAPGAWRRIGGLLAGQSRGIAAAAVLLALLLWALSLYPPHAFDETLYHLPFTRAFAETGALPFLEDLRIPVFPQLAEILAVPLYLFGDDVDSHAISWLSTLAVAGLLWDWNRGDRGAGMVAAAFWLGAPIIVYLAGLHYVEPLLALLIAAACYSLARAGYGGGAESHEPGRWRSWLLLCGFLAGSAASVKYHALFFVAALGLAILVRRRWLPALLYGGAALGALLPSYARIVFHTGNPLFPFYPGLFGASAWSPSFEVAPAARNQPWLFLTLPWRVVFDRDSVGGLPPHSPGLLLAVPLAIYAAVREPRARLPLLLAAAYSLVAPMDARYLTLALPLLAVAAGLGAAGLGAAGLGATRWKWLRLPVAAVLLLVPGLLYAMFRAGRLGSLPTTPPARERFLETWLPVYPAVRFLNQREPEGYAAYALASEEMVYWARGRWLGDHNGLAAFGRVGPLFERPRSLHDELRRLGVRYLVAPRGRPAASKPGWRPPEDLFPLIYRDALAEIYAVGVPAAQ